MKILKETSNYLKEQMEFNKKASIVFFLIGILGLIFSFMFANFIFVCISGFIIVIGGHFLVQYTNYSGGLGGEKIVIEMLRNLDDDHYLINDVMLPERYGNIDHILLCPNGIFVIETKNYEGEIICDGDEWHRHYEGGFTISMRGRPYWKEPRDYDMGSPSKQVKGNAVKLKQLIESQKNIFKNPLKIWVEGIVVFTNPNVNLKLNEPTVTVLKVEELYDYLKNKESKIKFSSKELESIGNLILKAALR